MIYIRVLICDDNIAVRETVALYLKHEGIEFDVAEDGENALYLFGKKDYDLVLLDVMLPGIDGVEVCRNIRKTCSVPIIMLSAKGEEEHRITGLEAGADDYMTKPFSPREVVVKVKNFLNRWVPQKERNIEKAAELLLDKDSYIVTVSGEKIDLTAREIDVLYYFMKNKDRVLTRDQILNAVWGYEYEGDARAVDTQIKRIRKKLPNVGVHFNIKAIYGVGYKFEVEK